MPHQIPLGFFTFFSVPPIFPPKPYHPVKLPTTTNATSMRPSQFLSVSDVPSSPMAFSSGLRYSTLLLRHRPSLLLAPTRLSSGLRHTLPDLRFLSSNRGSFSRSPTLQSAVVKARRRDETGKEDGDDGQDGNGSVLVKGRVGRDGGDGGDGGRVVPTELHKEATEAYMAYAMSVLVGRALPDVRDGLKPVHRRIL